MRPVVILAVKDDTSETEGLAASLGHSVIHRVVQRRHKPDAATFVGAGRVQELASWLADTHPPVSGGGSEKWLVLADAELRPSQVFNLEDSLGVEVWDRIRLILELFQANAGIREARLQVELARLRYEIPLIHEAVHRKRSGERPGFLSGGEYEVRAYETHAKARMKAIRVELARIRNERGARRKGRRRTGFLLAAVTGYTNAGKSQLLNSLCESDALVESRFFSTLQTRTRRLSQDLAQGFGSPLLVTDTVGFIHGLPPWLIDAFSATMEEAAFSDAVLLVADASEPIPIVMDKLSTGLRILEEIGAAARILIVLNKQDKLSSEHAAMLKDALQIEPALIGRPVVWVAAKTGTGLSGLLEVLKTRLLSVRTAFADVTLDDSRHLSFRSWLYDHAQIQEADGGGGTSRLTIMFNQDQLGNLLRMAQRAGVDIDLESSSGNRGGTP